MGVQHQLVALFPLLSIALAMFSAWCAFRCAATGLLGFAVFAALVHLSRFYYLYGTTLTVEVRDHVVPGRADARRRRAAAATPASDGSAT